MHVRGKCLLSAITSWEEVMKRKRGLIAAGILFLSLPMAAQDKNGAAESAANKPDSIVRSNREPASLSGVRLQPRSVLALPDAPRATPFPAAANSTAGAPGRLVPRYELAGGYSYVNFNPGSPFP